MSRSWMVVVLLLVPGGLVILGAWLLTRLVLGRLRAGKSPSGQQPVPLARRWSELRWRDLLEETRGELLRW